MGLDMYLMAGPGKVRVAYWRKANAIHAWFVDNCGDGKDECQEIPVTRTDLKELALKCADVLAAEDLGRGAVTHKLQTRSGFFFGSTEYDEGYKQDIEETLAICEKALATDYETFTYQASW